MLIALSIVEEFLGDNTSKLVAKTILKAQNIYEDSWNIEKTKHNISHEDAAYEACLATGLDIPWSKYIAHLNWCAWNDIQGWADAILDKN